MDKNNQTFKSNRVSKLKITFKELKDILTFIFKIRSITYLRILKILFDFKFNKKRERLRNVDFLLHFDIFLWALKNKESKINVFYTNHIASQIHRYIGALLPNKTIRKIFGQKWIKKNSNEVFYSINLFEKQTNLSLHEKISWIDFVFFIFKFFIVFVIKSLTIKLIESLII